MNKKILTIALILSFSLYGVTASADKPFPAPSNLSATAVSSSQINLSWSDNSSDPYTDIITGLKTIEAATGLKATRMVVGGEVWYDGLLNHPDIVDRVKHTTFIPRNGLQVSGV